MNSSTHSLDPKTIAIGVGALLLLFLALWVSWKISKLVIKASLTLLLLLSAAGTVWWFFLRR